jgi:hypothetical protein
MAKLEYLTRSASGGWRSSARRRTGPLSSAEGELELVSGSLVFRATDPKHSLTLAVADLTKNHATWVSLDLRLRDGQKVVFAFGTGAYMHSVGQFAATRTISREWQEVIDVARQEAAVNE